MDSPNKISSATLKPPDKLVVDANPIISALLGGAALRNMSIILRLFAIEAFYQYQQ